MGNELFAYREIIEQEIDPPPYHTVYLTERHKTTFAFTGTGETFIRLFVVPGSQRFLISVLLLRC